MLLFKIIPSKILRRIFLRRHLSQLLSLEEIYRNKNYTFTLPDGSKFIYPLHSTVGRSLFLGEFELSEIEFIRKILKPGDTFLDIGANGGLYSIIAAKIVGHQGHVYACEPGKKELDLLKQNITINGINNITIIESAISNKKGSDLLAVSVDGALNSLKETNHPDQNIESWQTVEINTVDNLVQELNIPKINVMKVDVEGAEKLVFEGASNFLKSNSNVTIVFESSELNSNDFGYKPEELISNLQSKGFKLKYISRIGFIKNISTKNMRIHKNIYNFIAQK